MIIENKIKENEKINNELKIKNEELNKLKSKLFDKYYIDNNKNEKLFSINFTSVDQSFLYPITCNENDSISKLEQEVYNEYPKYKDYNTYLTVNGNIIKRFKTVKENGIKKGNAILVNIIEDESSFI